MDNLVARFTEVFVFIDDILIVTKGTENGQMVKVREIPITLHVANLHTANLSGLGL